MVKKRCFQSAESSHITDPFLENPRLSYTQDNCLKIADIFPKISLPLSTCLCYRIYICMYTESEVQGDLITRIFLFLAKSVGFGVPFLGFQLPRRRGKR